MARLCIRIAPNDHPTDPRKTPLRTQPGDVVEVCEDGHVWRLNNEDNTGPVSVCGQYRFVDVPGVPAADLTYLKDIVSDASGTMLRRRSVALDTVALDRVDRIKRASAMRTTINAVTMTRRQITDMTVKRT